MTDSNDELERHSWACGRLDSRMLTNIHIWIPSVARTGRGGYGWPWLVRNPLISFSCPDTPTMSDFEEELNVGGGAADEENEEVEDYDEEQDERSHKSSRRDHDDEDEDDEEEEEEEEEEDAGVERGKKRRVRVACAQAVLSCH